MNNQVRIQHARTKMYVARGTNPKLGLHQIASRWCWVREAKDALVFDTDGTIHPILQMNIAERDVVLEQVQ